MQVERSVYNSLMLLGDLGGLYGILVYIAYLILGYLNFKKFENILAQDLFNEKGSSLKASDQVALKEYAQDCFFEFCSTVGCLWRKRKDKLFMRARDLYAEELDVVSVIQQRRFFNMALKKLMKKDNLVKLKKKARKIDLKSDSSSASQDEVLHEENNLDQSAPPSGNRYEEADVDPHSIVANLAKIEEESHSFDSSPARDYQ